MIERPHWRSVYYSTSSAYSPRCFALTSRVQSISILESRQSLNRLPASIHALVGSVELEVQQEHNNDDQAVGKQASNDAGDVIRRILASEDCAANDSSNAAGADQRC